MVPVQVALRVVVHLADAERVITRIAQHARLFVLVLHRYPMVPQHPVSPRAQAGQQGRPGRRARGCAGIRAAESGPLGRESIEVRRLNDAIPIRPEAVAPELIGHQEQDVGAGRPLLGGRRDRTGRQYDHHAQWPQSSNSLLLAHGNALQATSMTLTVHHNLPRNAPVANTSRAGRLLLSGLDATRYGTRTHVKDRILLTDQGSSGRRTRPLGVSQSGGPVLLWLTAGCRRPCPG